MTQQKEMDEDYLLMIVYQLRSKFYLQSIPSQGYGNQTGWHSLVPKIDFADMAETIMVILLDITERDGWNSFSRSELFGDAMDRQ